MREPFDQNNKSIEIAQRLPLCTGQILSKYVSIQDASDPAQFERARSWDKDQESQRVQVFYRNLERGVLLKVGRCLKTRRKRWIKKSSMQPRNVQSFLPEIVSYKQKQRDDVSVGRIQRFFSGWSESLPYIKKSTEFISGIIWTPISLLQTQEVYEKIVS